MAENLQDWRWRFTNLYYIKPAEDMPVLLFEPRPEQWEILEDIYERGQMRIAILKSRQLGFSTLLALVCLDWLLFRPGCRIGLVDQAAADAEKKLGKIFLAWEHLPSDLRQCYQITAQNKGEFAIRLRDPEDVKRTFYAGKNPRGDTHDLLWISEWGPIQVEDVHRSDKIADGGLPSVEKGVCVIETTWRGGKSGRLWFDVVKGALMVQEAYRIARDWLVRFYPWYCDPALRWEGSAVQITEECRKYLDEAERLAVAESQRLGLGFDGFDDRQRLWYYKTVWPKPRRSRFEEYPTLMVEMFQSPKPGAIYTDEMSTLRSESRLCSIPIEKAHKAIVSADLGRQDAMPLTFWQWIGQEHRIVDFHTANREKPSYYADFIANWCFDHEIRNVQILLPHDSKQKTLAADKSVEEQFGAVLEQRHGLQFEISVVDVIASVWDGIDDVRELFPYIWISTRADQETIRGDMTFPGVVDCLEQYHSKEIREGVQIQKEPIHDIYSHGCDSVRTYAEGQSKGLVHRASQRRRKPKVVTGAGALMAPDQGGQRKKPRVRGRMT